MAPSEPDHAKAAMAYASFSRIVSMSPDTEEQQELQWLSDLIDLKRAEQGISLPSQIRSAT